MHHRIRPLWDIPESRHTPEDVYRNRQQHRREFLRWLGISGAAASLPWLAAGCGEADDKDVVDANRVDIPIRKQEADGDQTTGADTNESAADTAETKDPFAGVPRNSKFEYGRDETPLREVAEYTNFYEFSSGKDSWKLVGDFNPVPWEVKVDGLCAKPMTFDLDDLFTGFSLEERHLRHRCVETWAMCVPWIGFPLRDLLKRVEPDARATHVAFETFNRPTEAPGMADFRYDWPYVEGLTIAEATNIMSFFTLGMYGEPLLKQNGAPVRLVLPWKYGFKSIKSVVRITLTDSQPTTFWNGLMPYEYKFEANVDPNVPHPRWSQATEWMLGTRERFETKEYNGYGEYVGSLYG